MRVFFLGVLLAMGATGLLPESASASETVSTPGQDVAQAAMRVFGKTRPPYGYVSFCNRHFEECARKAADTAPVHLNARRWQELNAINTTVNVTVAPVTDLDRYRTVEYWTYPDGSGDCEDYVLAKRRLLIEQGWPASALLITVVLDEENLGHAVLTVVTDQGDFVLDNKNPAIRNWRDTPYRFQKRQSQTDPLSWVSLNGDNELRLPPGGPVAAK